MFACTRALIGVLIEILNHALRIKQVFFVCLLVSLLMRVMPSAKLPARESCYQLSHVYVFVCARVLREERQTCNSDFAHSDFV